MDGFPGFADGAAWRRCCGGFVSASRFGLLVLGFVFMLFCVCLLGFVVEVCWLA